jgi:tetratricopeptide (TPR) repeat protein
MPRWVLGLAKTCIGEYAHAIASFRDSLDMCERIGDRALQSRVLNSLGWCFAEIGCHRHASEFNRRGAAVAQELLELGQVAGAPEILSNASINLACNRVALGDCDGALELLAPIRDGLDQPGDPWQRWRYGMHVGDALARTLLARGEPERALPLVEEELREARHQLSKKLQARALELRGRILLHLERPRDAGESLGEALALARGSGYPPVTWRALSLLAEGARRAGERGEAERLAGEARGLVTGLARRLPDGELRLEFGALAERLVSDPLEAYR